MVLLVSLFDLKCLEVCGPKVGNEEVFLDSFHPSFWVLSVVGKFQISFSKLAASLGLNFPVNYSLTALPPVDGTSSSSSLFFFFFNLRRILETFPPLWRLVVFFSKLQFVAEESLGAPVSTSRITVATNLWVLTCVCHYVSPWPRRGYFRKNLFLV